MILIMEDLQDLGIMSMNITYRYYPVLEDYKTGELALFPDFGDGRKERNVMPSGCAQCHHTCKTCRSWSAISCTACDAESMFRPMFWAANAGTNRVNPGTGECVPNTAVDGYF